MTSPVVESFGESCFSANGLTEPTAALDIHSSQRPAERDVSSGRTEGAAERSAYLEIPNLDACARTGGSAELERVREQSKWLLT